ncbi:hypothetical protein J6590_082009 [Homalodisca vitripennis]|nr:hypothetical protein J6590_082009 [Homalodisca vitripennis]
MLDLTKRSMITVVECCEVSSILLFAWDRLDLTKRSVITVVECCDEELAPFHFSLSGASETTQTVINLIVQSGSTSEAREQKHKEINITPAAIQCISGEEVFSLSHQCKFKGHGHQGPRGISSPVPSVQCYRLSPVLSVQVQGSRSPGASGHLFPCTECAVLPALTGVVSASSRVTVTRGRGASLPLYRVCSVTGSHRCCQCKFKGHGHQGPRGISSPVPSVQCYRLSPVLSVQFGTVTGRRHLFCTEVLPALTGVVSKFRHVGHLFLPRVLPALTGVVVQVQVRSPGAAGHLFPCTECAVLPALTGVVSASSRVTVTRGRRASLPLYRLCSVTGSHRCCQCKFKGHGHQGPQGISSPVPSVQCYRLSPVLSVQVQGSRSPGAAGHLFPCTECAVLPALTGVVLN